MKASDNNPVRVVGVGMGADDLPAALAALVREAGLLVGGERHLAAFGGLPCRKLIIRSPLAGTVEEIRSFRERGKVVVLASGDPLFFGIGRTLIKELGEENVEIFPNVSSLAAAFGRLKKPWANVPVVSLHGRAGEDALLGALRGSAAVFVLTGPDRSPAWIGRFLQENRVPGTKLFVLEEMGSPGETLQELTPAQAAGMDFREPNAVVLTRAEPGPAQRDPCLGAPEHWYEHDAGVITKAEVRAVSLSRLRLSDGLVLWDLGAGSGSLSCEAGLFIKSRPIVAVEKNPGRVKHIRANRERFGIWNLAVVQAELPEGMDGLPDPDRIFVGGGGRSLGPIVREAAMRLRPGGVMVVNAVLLESLHAGLAAMEGAGLETGVVQVQAARGTSLSHGRMLSAENPVWVLFGTKGKGEDLP
ncbi:MAG: precorrin-6y C5,15-methyltransferase (decarboxylating) subunit CbiE [Thermodesulfobacteriota bacterium]